MARKGIGDTPEMDVLDDTFGRLKGLAKDGQVVLSVADLSQLEGSMRHTWQGEKTYIRKTPAEAFAAPLIDPHDVAQRGVDAVARELGLNRRTIYRMLRKAYGGDAAE